MPPIIINQSTLSKIENAFSNTKLDGFVLSELSSLSKAYKKHINPNMILLKLLQDDLVASKELFWFTEDKVNEKIRFEKAKITQYLETIFFAESKYKKSKKIDYDLIKSMHAIITKNHERLNPKTRPGVLRKEIVFLGLPGCTVEGAEVVCLSPDLIKEYIDDIVTSLASLPNSPSIKLIGRIYFQFIATHPFGDGNGRLSRTLVPLMFMHAKVAQYPNIWISSFSESKRTLQNQAFNSVFTDKDFSSWDSFFLDMIMEYIQIAKIFDAKILKIQQDFQCICEHDDLPLMDRLSLKMISELFFFKPEWHVFELTKDLGLSKRSFERIIHPLLSSGLLNWNDSEHVRCDSIFTLLYDWQQ